MSTATAKLNTAWFSKRVAGILDRGHRQFAEHELTQELDNDLFRSWTCKRPKSSSYAFRVTTVPGWLYLSGDIGHLALSRVADMITWTRDVVTSESVDLGYLAEKAPKEIATKEFNHELALASFDEHFKGAEIEYEHRLEVWEKATQATDEFEWNFFRWDHMAEDWMEYFESNGKDYSASLCWQVLALRRFFELLDA